MFNLCELDHLEFITDTDNCLPISLLFRSGILFIAKDNYHLCINMHKLSEQMHKSSLLRKQQNEEPKDEENFEHQDRLAKVLSLHSQGYSRR